MRKRPTIDVCGEKRKEAGTGIPGVRPLGAGIKHASTTSVWEVISLQPVELTWQLGELADLHQLCGSRNREVEDLRRYASLAQTISGDRLRYLVEQGQTPGFDPEFLWYLRQWYTGGVLEELKDMRGSVSDERRQLLHLPSVDPARARLFIDALGIDNLEQLWAAGKDRRIQKLPGLEAKTERTILREIESFRNPGKPVSLGIALEAGRHVERELLRLEQTVRVELAGELRRWVDAVHVVCLVAAVDDSEGAAALFSGHPLVQEVFNHGQALCFRMGAGLTAEIHFTDNSSFIERWWRCTGSEAHVEGVKRRLPTAQTTFDDEEALYKAAGLSYVEPELRENRGEVELAEQDQLPAVLSLGAIRADLHMHTDATDGVSTLEDMVSGCMKKGYSHMAICDHSASLTHANGLSRDRLVEQGEEIERLRERLCFPILKGIEVDILLDGRLDYDDELLASMDLVIASIHSGFPQDEETMTARLVGAAQHPHVDIIAHPTGRLVCYREPYAVDMERLLAACRDYGTALEINAAPERLDLNEHYTRQAMGMGIPIVINTDAHSVKQLDLMRYGVHYSRRAWVTAKECMNAWSLDRLRKYLELPKNKRLQAIQADRI